MIEVIRISGVRDFTNPEPSPKGHWVELVFRNDHGVHTLELNGKRALPNDAALKSDLEWLLWDYGLLSQEYGGSAEERATAAQELFWSDRQNYLRARAYMENLGAQQG